jgi:hypothetical protein
MDGRDTETRNKQSEIVRVGAGGEVGQGQTGEALHKPHGKRDCELGERERFGAGGKIGEGQSGEKLHKP